MNYSQNLRRLSRPNLLRCLCRLGILAFLLAFEPANAQQVFPYTPPTNPKDTENNANSMNDFMESQRDKRQDPFAIPGSTATQGSVQSGRIEEGSKKTSAGPLEQAVKAEAGKSPGGKDAIEKAESLVYDARIIGFDRKNNTVIFEGDVIVIAGGTIITADSMKLNEQNKSLNASGHVIVLTNSEIFTGEELVYFWETGDLKITEAILVAFDQEAIKRESNKILGFSPEETYFEDQRKERLEYINSEKKRLREEYYENAVFGVPPADKYVTPYSILLEQEDLAAKIPNGALGKLSKKRREDYLKRREFWSQQRALQANAGGIMGSYFRIEGRELTRTNGNDFRAVEADWTPCFCESDENPLWGFHAQRIDAQSGGYVDFEDAVLEIKGIPVLYLPRLKLPLKGQRQSGFLMPTLRTGDRKIGTVYTQPVYFAFAPDFDSTLTTDFFQDKGTRLGIEARYKLRSQSGFEYRFDTIRDRSWIEARHTRERLKAWYDSPDGPHCNDKSGFERTQCLEQVKESLAVPGNTWRGSQEWEGSLFLTDRISFATHGKIRSDHRYVEDLKLTDEIEAAFQPNLFADTFNTVKSRIFYDGSEFFLGATSAFGDNVLIPAERYSGMQIPGRVDFVSRYHDLNSYDILPLPIYGNLEYTFLPIQERNAKDFLKDGEPTLGSGQWSRVAANFASPIKTDGLYTVDYFADVQFRRIRHSGPGDSTSQIFSRRQGLSAHLPMDGLGVMPDFLRFFEDESETDGGRYIHHFMDWKLSFTQRPVVIRRGDYGDYYELGEGVKGAESLSPPLVYMMSDHPKAHIPAGLDENKMRPESKISLELGNRWRTYRKSWSKEFGVPKKQLAKTIGPEEIKRAVQEKAFAKEQKEQEKLAIAAEPDFKERARRELTYSRDRLVKSYDEMFTELQLATPPVRRGRDGRFSDAPGAFSGEDEHLLSDYSLEPTTVAWHVNRYRLVEQDAREPISAGFGVSYDFEQEKERQREIRQNREIEALEGPNSSHIKSYYELARPWRGGFGLGLNWAGYSIGMGVEYHMYVKTPESLNFTFGVPGFWNSSVSGSYQIKKQPLGPQGSLTFERESVTTIAFDTSLIPKIGTRALFIKKTVEGRPKSTYSTILGFTYLDNSGCWGLELLRKKEEYQEEEDASYIINFRMIFVGHDRGQNIAPAIMRHVRDET